MDCLSHLVTYEDVIRHGALQVVTEADVMQLSGGARSMPLGSILRLPLGLKSLSCLLMHEDLIPADKMHQTAAALAEAVLDRMAAEGVYIDFRSRRAIAAKRSWLGREISLGELNLAVAKAQRAIVDLWDLQDARVSLGAEMALAAAGSDPRTSVLVTLGNALDAYGTREDEAQYRSIIEQQLRRSQ